MNVTAVVAGTFFEDRLIISITINQVMRKYIASALVASCFLIQNGHSQETLQSTRSFSGSSQDWWDQRFHPKQYQERQKARLEEWYKSWGNTLCSADHVKQYWLLTLLIPEPSSLAGDHKAIAARNDAIRYTIGNGNVDFEAADLADQINVENLSKKGRTTEAASIERGRQSRIKERNELIERQQMIAAAQAREAALQQQIDLLAQRVAQAQAQANQAQAQAQENAMKARQMEQEQRWNEQQQRTRDFMNRR